jgi:hypothetical protein
VVPRSTTFVFKVLCTLVQNFGVNQFRIGAQQNKSGLNALCAATSRAPARRALPPCVGRLGVHTRTPPKPRAFPRLMSCPEMSRFYPAPRVASRRPRRTRARRAPGGPPVRPAPRRTRRSRLHRTTAESTPSPCRHRRSSALFRAAIFPLTPVTTAHARSTAPP